MLFYLFGYVLKWRGSTFSHMFGFPQDPTEEIKMDNIGRTVQHGVVQGKVMDR